MAGLESLAVACCAGRADSHSAAVRSVTGGGRAQVIAENIKNGGDLNPMIPGQKARGPQP